jgi:hypothetical protein
MIAVALILIVALAVIALVVFVALVVGMRNEPTYDRLSTWAPSPLARLTRRMLGVSVRMPSSGQPDADQSEPREPWFAGAGYTPTRRDDEGR